MACTRKALNRDSCSAPNDLCCASPECVVTSVPFKPLPLPLPPPLLLAAKDIVMVKWSGHVPAAAPERPDGRTIIEVVLVPR